ncbi:hypothetical protein [Methanobrevibacter sp.]|uniref:hypothetical protein n=1 Tax=Methanobrevibacter sp. TaxID=66852 RepID=UPI0026DEDABC|nr:hypothetical protein [Methanobrevibacter sp.]MDO5859246.1 hypothetical protein [Methanobrevibacter sp.]
MANKKFYIFTLILVIVSISLASAVSAGDNTADSLANIENGNDVDGLLPDDDYDPDDDWEDDDDWEEKIITAKLEIIDYPKQYGENKVTFKLTNEADNSSLANVDLSVIGYVPNSPKNVSGNDKLGADSNSKPLTFLGDIYNLTKITTDSNGIAIYTIPEIFTDDFCLMAGFYIDDGISSSTTINYNGVETEVYLTDFVNANMTSFATVASIGLSKEGSYYGDVVLKVSMITVLNHPLSNKTVEIRFSNGKTVRLTTNSNGTATYKIPFGAGTYSATANVVSERIVANSTKLDGIVISKAPVNIKPTKIATTYASGKYFQIKLINTQTNKAVSGARLTLKIYTGSKYKTVTVTTDSKGVAKYSTSSLSVGAHKVVISIKDTAYCTGSSKTSSITVSKSAISISAPKQYSVYKKGPAFKVTVTNKVSKKAVNGIAVTVKIKNGKTYQTLTAKTNSKGEASFSTKALTKGSHVVSITTKANSNYKAASAKSSAVVLAKKITTSLSVWEGVRFIANGYVMSYTFGPTLRDANGKELVKPIKIYSGAYTWTENSGSIFGLPPSGYNTYTFRFEGDGLYEGSHWIVTV